MKYIINIIICVVLMSCGEKTDKKETNSDLTAVTVQEVIQVKEYSYIRVLENDSEKWIAVQSSSEQ